MSVYEFMVAIVESELKKTSPHLTKLRVGNSVFLTNHFPL